MKTERLKNNYKQMERFAHITKEFIIQGNIARAKKCFAIAENIFETGSKEMKNVVSNVFVFSVSSFMEWHHCNIRNLFPTSLNTEYQKQINTSGI